MAESDHSPGFWDEESLPVGAAAGLGAALAALMRAQVSRLALAQRAGEPAARAAAVDALCGTMELAARLHMLQLLRLDDGLRPPDCIPAGLPGSAGPEKRPGGVRGRGQGFLPPGKDPFAGGLAILQACVRGDARRDYLCYSAMRDDRMLILIGRPGTLRAAVSPEPGGSLCRLEGRGVLIFRRQDGAENRCTGWFTAVVRHGGGGGSFSVTVRRAPAGPPEHAGGPVPIGGEDLTPTG